MAIDTYLHIDGIKGESTDGDHKDWIEVLSISPEPAAQAKGVAEAAVKPQTKSSGPGEIVITKQVDASSPKLSEMASSGKHIQKVMIELMRASGDKPVKYMAIEMDQVVISGVRDGVSPHITERDHPTESVTFNYGQIKWTYTQQK